MKRKVIQLAKKTLVISLPTRWAKKYNIKKGDEIEAEEIKNKLIISPEKELTKEGISIDVSGLSPMIYRILGAIYKAGYDEVEVHYESEKDLEEIEEVTKREFIGFEIVKKGKKSLVIKSVSEINYEEFDNVLRRTFLIIMEIGEESFEAMKNVDKKALLKLIELDKEVNKYADFCRRILNKKGYASFIKTQTVYFIVEELEKISDSYRDLCKASIEINKKISKDIEAVFKEVNAFFREFYELYYKFDLNKLAEHGKKRNVLLKDLMDLMKKTSKEELLFLFLLSLIVEEIFNMNGALIASKI